MNVHIQRASAAGVITAVLFLAAWLGNAIGNASIEHLTLVCPVVIDDQGNAWLPECHYVTEDNAP